MVSIVEGSFVRCPAASEAFPAPYSVDPATVSRGIKLARCQAYDSLAPSVKVTNMWSYWNVQCVYYHRFIGQLRSLCVGYCTVCCLIYVFCCLLCYNYSF
jgi:hypothetical protein